MATHRHRTTLLQLRRLSKSITERVHDVNNGGCGFVAYLVAEQLEARGLMVEIVTPTDGWSLPAAAVRPNVHNPAKAREWDDNGLRRSHLAVRFRSDGTTYTWDSDGLRRSASKFGGKWTYKTTSKFGDGLRISEVKAMCKSQAGWNRTFDRQQLPLLRHLVKHHLEFGL